jgi:hypothetical protein
MEEVVVTAWRRSGLRRWPPEKGGRGCHSMEEEWSEEVVARRE